MESLKNLYRIGTGPSSSHTMAPSQAAHEFLRRYPDADRYRVELYASLAATGKGHLTDKAIEEAISPLSLEIIWKEQEELPLHPNGMLFEAMDHNGRVFGSWEVYSVGGGALMDRETRTTLAQVYPLSRMEGLLKHLRESGGSFPEYAEQCEGAEIWDFFDTVWRTMRDSIQRGLAAEGLLPGGLDLPRKALSIYSRSKMLRSELRTQGALAAYAYAVSEENADKGIIVTAPTCGACGVLPAVLYHLQKTLELPDAAIIRALATAGIVGNLVKTNAGISGAEVGCQGEIGTACAMAAAAATELMEGSIRQIEYAAEMAIEHHLGLTCDPVAGLVQIPCIERNAHAAMRAMSCCHLALLSDGEHQVSFDKVTAVMKETGQALPSLYRETSAGGLAKACRSIDTSASAELNSL
ncbi:L-serine ammonia-lyase, iron-sulfur-dependent, subunit alpha [Desulfopila inferna]|uniref:L-serine ammonia-lyase, iron-sulfur-dependent, subunit alpha n=1 Tax=Desulfopila inferna TaxID=468528 RepID=UPI0019663716|nr:L-serine ammonia-lyase, iron-sulfur-dependent, subunit alpha [Desulfopila inferna]MBM9604772.1 L-serine ammonia-lyase, iron-sulfur-dependent, subunit alpha [Desulfopila inferna]